MSASHPVTARPSFFPLFVLAFWLLTPDPAPSQPIELVSDIVPGGNGSFPSQLLDNNGLLYFWAIGTEGTGYALRTTDGTDAGTNYVDDLDDPDISLNYREPVVAGGKLFFEGRTNVLPNVDSELWVSDGQSIELTRDILNGGNGSNPRLITRVGDQVYFIATAPGIGDELWRSDGTLGGTVNVAEINPGEFAHFYDPNIGWSRAVRQEGSEQILYFLAQSPRLDPGNPDTAGGFELWRTDGTEVGTELVVDMYPGAIGSVPNSSTPFSITVVGDDILFACNTPTSGRELCRWDGVSGSVAADIAPGPHPANGNPHQLIAIGDTLYFMADNGSDGRELWRWSAIAGASMVADLTPGPMSSSLDELTAFGGALYFTFNDGDAANGLELWRASGGTVALVRDIASGVDGGGNAWDSSPAELTPSGAYLYFSAWTPTEGRELWRTDGTLIGTELVEDLRPGTGWSDPSGLANSQGTLYFSATHPSLWRELFRVGPPPLVFGNGFESGDLTGWSP